MGKHLEENNRKTPIENREFGTQGKCAKRLNDRTAHVVSRATDSR